MESNPKKRSNAGAGLLLLATSFIFANQFRQLEHDNDIYGLVASGIIFIIGIYALYKSRK